MKLSNALLLISWVPLLQLQGFSRIQNSIELTNWNWFFLIAIVVTFIGVWLLIKCIPKKSEFPHPAIKCILIVFFSIFLLAIPVFSCIVKIFAVKFFFDSEKSHFPLIISIISASLLCIVLFSAWKEVQEEDKSYIPVLKFILASLFLLWQLNLGIHLHYDLPFVLGYKYHPFDNFLQIFHILKLLACVIYVILNLLFFGWIFIRDKFKERQGLFFSSTGLLMMIGVFALLFGLINGAKLLPEYPAYYLTIFSLTFTTIIGPVLMIAVVLVFLGGILSFFKKGLRQSGFSGVVRKKSIVISLAAVILYLLLFKTLWPFQDPAHDILFRSAKKFTNRYSGEWKAIKAIHANSYLEFWVYGKRVVRYLINKLDDNEASARQLSADFLEFLGDERAVEPLIKSLKDRDRKVRDIAAVALLHIKDPRAVNPLVEVLEKNDLHCFVRLMLFLWKLGVWGDPRFIDPLVDKLYEEEEELNKSIISALNHFKDVRMVVDKLIERLNKEKPSEVIRVINYALIEITGQAYNGKEEKAAQWWQQWWRQNRENFIREKKWTQ